MKLWCKKCLMLMEHQVVRTYTANGTPGRRLMKDDRIDLTPHDGVTPLAVHAICECSQVGRFVGRR